MLFRVNHSSGIPLYVQLIEQVKHAIELGAFRPGEQLPTMRKVAEDLIMNANTVARAYRELEHAGLIEVRHGAGAFIREELPKPNRHFRKAKAIMQDAIERLVVLGLSHEEIRRLVENELPLSLSNNKEAVPNG